jgi:type I restriction enzyme R subunit
VPHEEALRIRDDVGFFQAVRAVLAKGTPGERKTDEELEHAIRQIVSKAIVSDEVVDIFAAAGLKKPDISILSEEFLAEVRGMPQRNLAVELLQKLLKGEIRTRSRRNVVQARSFAELLEQSIRKYQNRAIETAQVIEELIELVKDMRAAAALGEGLGLSDDELAFYGALETNDSAVKVLGDETLRAIARGAGRDRAQERHHRLDDPRQRARQASGAREAHPAEVRLSPGQAGEGDRNGAGTGGGVIRGVERRMSCLGQAP